MGNGGGGRKSIAFRGWIRRPLGRRDEIKCLCPFEWLSQI